MSVWQRSEEIGGWFWHDADYQAHVHESGEWSAVGGSTPRVACGSAPTAEQAQAEALAKIEQWRAER